MPNYAKMQRGKFPSVVFCSNFREAGGQLNKKVALEAAALRGAVGYLTGI